MTHSCVIIVLYIGYFTTNSGSCCSPALPNARNREYTYIPIPAVPIPIRLYRPSGALDRGVCENRPKRNFLAEISRSYSLPGSADKIRTHMIYRQPYMQLLTSDDLSM